MGGSISFIMPHLVDNTGTLQKRDSNKTFGEPSLLEGIISALAFENNSAILFVSDFKDIRLDKLRSLIKFCISPFNAPSPTMINL